MRSYSTIVMYICSVVFVLCQLFVPVFVLNAHDLHTLNAASPGKASLPENYGKLPLTFEANQGQTDSRVKFLLRGDGCTLFLTPTEAILALNKKGNVKSPVNPKLEIQDSQSTVLRMKLVDANLQPEVIGLEEQPGKVNYCIGNDSRQWHTNIPTYAKIRYQDVYPGVDLVYYGDHRQLEYDFIVTPGFNPKAITMGLEGADKVKVDVQGNLVVYTNGGEVMWHKPVVYQEENGQRRPVDAKYMLKSNRNIGFRVAAYNTNLPLTIDPVLSYSTYLGGSSNDAGLSIAVDVSGNVYVTGATYSANFPTTNPLQSTGGDSFDAFATKLDPTGSVLIYSTYFGGSSHDHGFGIAVDTLGNVSITGRTHSVNFPTVNPLQPAYGGGSSDAFVTKLDSTGSAFIYSTYLGGGSLDTGSGIAVDTSGNAYVTGSTDSYSFPTANPLQSTYGGGSSDVFVTKLNSTGSAIVYSTYLGGSKTDQGFSIAVDTLGNAYVTGSTRSSYFPTANSLQSANCGSSDAFVTKLNSTGSAFIYSTYLGGSDLDIGCGIAVDTSGNAYVTGSTESYNFPTANPLQSTYGGGSSDAFVTKLNPTGLTCTGSAFIYSTYLGGSKTDQGFSIAVDTLGNAYVTGSTRSSYFPTVNSLQSANCGSSDAFVTKLDSTGSAFIYSTYLGGSDLDMGSGIAVDTSGNAYVTGSTRSTGFPIANPLQLALDGICDAFIAKISE
ncbi:MAG: SBBP repeat-containing protein [Candidatus Jettenia sp. CY-1]|nr:MAG: SBBP repeat-containing protein [Candidatus Jettenia sp. CY-1]